MATNLATLTSNLTNPIVLDLRIAPAATGTPTIPTGMSNLIQSVSRAAAGNYTITLNNQYPTAPTGVFVTVGDSALANVCAEAVAFTNTAVSTGSSAPGANAGSPQGGSTIQIFVFNGATGGGVDLAANASNFINVKLYFNNTALRPV